MVIEAGPRVAPEFDEDMSKYIAGVLQKRGVDVRVVVAALLILPAYIIVGEITTRAARCVVAIFVGIALINAAITAAVSSRYGRDTSGVVSSTRSPRGDSGAANISPEMNWLDTSPRMATRSAQPSGPRASMVTGR